MSTTRLSVALGTLLFLFLTVPVSAKQSTNEANDASIRSFVAELDSVWNRHDTPALAALFAEDADDTNFDGILFHGRKTIEVHIAQVLNVRFKHATRSDSVRNIRMLTPTLAVVDAYTTINPGVKTADGSPAPLVKGLMNTILVKRGGRWLILVTHEQGLPHGFPHAATTSK